MNLTALELATAVASNLGYEVDIEPMELGKVNVVAKREGHTLKFKGTSVTDACVKLIGALAPEDA